MNYKQTCIGNKGNQLEGKEGRKGGREREREKGRKEGDEERAQCTMYACLRDTSTHSIIYNEYMC